MGAQEGRERDDKLEETEREVYSFAPLGEHGEESTSRRPCKDNKDGADPQTHMSVGTTAAAAILVLSNCKHFRVIRVWNRGRKRGRGWRRGI